MLSPVSIGLRASWSGLPGEGFPGLATIPAPVFYASRPGAGIVLLGFGGFKVRVVSLG